MSEVYLYELAEIIRSKNAGPFLVTLDVFLRNASDYEHVKHSDTITTARIAEAYGIDEDAILGVYFWDPALAVKITLRRKVSSGGVGDDDVYGAAMHMPLMKLAVPQTVSSQLESGDAR